jgi:hypothetical protein
MGPVTLAAHVSIDTGATTGYVYLLGTVDSDSASALKALTITAGAGNVRFGDTIGQTAALYSVDVASAVTTDIFASLKTDGSTNISGLTTGVRIATTSKLNFGNVSTETNNTALVIDTSGGNGVFTLNNSGSTIVSQMHAPVEFKRGSGAINLNSTLYSTTGEYNNLSFTTASGSGGGTVTIASTIGGGTQASTSGLGDIYVDSVSNLSFQAGIASKSLVSLGGTGTITLATNGSVSQYYSGANGLQLASSSATSISVNLNATLTAAGAPVSLTTTAANIGLVISNTIYYRIVVIVVKLRLSRALRARAGAHRGTGGLRR